MRYSFAGSTRSGPAEPWFYPTIDAAIAAFVLAHLQYLGRTSADPSSIGKSPTAAISLFFVLMQIANYFAEHGFLHGSGSVSA